MCRKEAQWRLTHVFAQVMKESYLALMQAYAALTDCSLPLIIVLLHVFRSVGIDSTSKIPYKIWAWPNT